MMGAIYLAALLVSLGCMLLLDWRFRLFFWRAPAAAADASPGGESSNATHDEASTPSRSAATRYGSGSGLPRLTWSPVTTAANVPSGTAATSRAASTW